MILLPILFMAWTLTAWRYRLLDDMHLWLWGTEMKSSLCAQRRVLRHDGSADWDS